jgi:hypothetical protein
VNLLLLLALGFVAGTVGGVIGFGSSVMLLMEAVLFVSGLTMLVAAFL